MLTHKLFLHPAAAVEFPVFRQTVKRRVALLTRLTLEPGRGGTDSLLRIKGKVLYVRRNFVWIEKRGYLPVVCAVVLWVGFWIQQHMPCPFVIRTCWYIRDFGCSLGFHWRKLEVHTSFRIPPVAIAIVFRFLLDRDLYLTEAAFEASRTTGDTWRRVVRHRGRVSGDRKWTSLSVQATEDREGGMDEIRTGHQGKSRNCFHVF